MTDTAARATVEQQTLARADGVQLIGELGGSGYKKPPSLVRRADGQTVQLTQLLYAVLEAVDGRRTPEEVAAAVSDSVDRHVTAADVTTLVDSQLRPLGLMLRADGTQPEVRRSNPLLALRLKWVVTDPERTRRITRPFAALFAPVVVAAVTLTFLATAGWVLFEKGLAAATHQAFDRPGLLLLVFAITILSAGFHEFGHAAACRYGGATPGAMGTGLYLVWPAFYTEVTDSYRLGKAGRVRVDLGGLYFNALFAVAMFGVWAATGFDALLLIIAAQVLQMVRQLAPLVRFDGYHVLADVTGVPDLFHHIKPTLLSMWPTRWRRGEETALKPWARAVVTTWVLLVVPLLVGSLLLMVTAFPRVAGTAWASVQRQWGVLEGAVAAGDPAAIVLRILSIVAIVLPVAATVYLVVRLVRRSARGAWRWSDGSVVRRAVVVATVLAIVAGLAYLWWPRPEAYRPIQPTERGTLLTAVGAQQEARPAVRLEEGQVSRTTTLWAGSAGLAGPGAARGAATPVVGDQSLPTKEDPAVALVLVPSDPESEAPTWVFPFDAPDAPGPGDNQALAVNTTDGTVVYDVAFALVWVDGQDDVLNTNEAYALASCTGCAAVAVGFQVVLVLGQADVVIPQNLAAAVNYSCVSCVTYALAQQLVVTLPGSLSDGAMTELDEVWAAIQAFGASIQGVPLSEIRSTLAGFEQQILDIIAADLAHEPVPDATTPDDVAPGGSGPEPSTSATADEPEASTTPSDAPTAQPSSEATTGEPSTSATSSTTSPSGSPSPTETSSASAGTVSSP